MTIIQVGTGADMETHDIPKGILCGCSQYFRCCLNGPFKEALDGSLVLDDEDPALFGAFKIWLFTRDISRALGHIRPESPKGRRILIDLWIFGDKRVIALLQDAANDLFCDTYLHGDCSIACDMEHVYSNTAPGAYLREVIIDMMTWTLAIYRNDTRTAAIFHSTVRHGLWSTESLADLAIACANQHNDTALDEYIDLTIRRSRRMSSV